MRAPQQQQQPSLVAWDWFQVVSPFGERDIPGRLARVQWKLVGRVAGLSMTGQKAKNNTRGALAHSLEALPGAWGAGLLPRCLGLPRFNLLVTAAAP